eukprot:scaffold14602_cov118-Isochrysis_galbana.AAC.12
MNKRWRRARRTFGLVWVTSMRRTSHRRGNSRSIKTKLRVRVEANDGAPTAPAGAGGGRHGRGKGLEASPR